MNDLSTQVNTQEEWFDAHQAAPFLKISFKQVRVLWKKYHIQLEKYLLTIPSRGNTGTKTFINKEGLVVLTNIRDGFRGNQIIKESKGLVSEPLQGKKKIAETAIAATQLSNELLNDPFIQLRLKQLQQDHKIAILEKKLEDTTIALTTPVETTAGERQFLNDRVKGYVKQMKETYNTEIPYYNVWNQIHEHVGVHGIANFKFKHYMAAKKYLEQMFNDAGLIW
jgi:hypothetical protein